MEKLRQPTYSQFRQTFDKINKKTTSFRFMIYFTSFELNKCVHVKMFNLINLNCSDVIVLDQCCEIGGKIGLALASTELSFAKC